MPDVGIRELLEAGVHFGHQTRRWNPKMRRYIHGERDGIYIIDLLKTEQLLRQALDFAGDVARRGGAILFVGTKKQARDSIKQVAEESGMPYVNHRWLGGVLTNFQTISQRIKRLHDLERYETEGQLELLPTRERMAAQADLAKLRANLGGVKNMAPPAAGRLRRRPQDRGDRRARGPAPAHPGHRPRRHELRPGRDRLRRPGQRRRDPLLRPDHARASATSIQEGRRAFSQAEEERMRARGRGAGAQGGRGAGRKREAEEQAPQGGRGGRGSAAARPSRAPRPRAAATARSRRPRSPRPSQEGGRPQPDPKVAPKANKRRRHARPARTSRRAREPAPAAEADGPVVNADVKDEATAEEPEAAKEPAGAGARDREGEGQVSADTYTPPRRT